jgi:hypothetical protein
MMNLLFSGARSLIRRLPWIAPTACVLALSAPFRAEAQLTLTQAGIDAGYQLTVFAEGFPNANSNGPLGMAFRNTGILVSDYYGNVRAFPTTADGQNANSVTPAQNFGMANAEDIVRLNDAYYMARRVQGDVVQLNEGGTLNHVVYSGLKGSPALYLCANPTTGHLLVSTGICHQIWDVDPANGTTTLWKDNLTSPAQMVFSEDGEMLFVAMDTNPGNILGIDATTKEVIFDYASSNPTTPLNKPAGIAVGSGDQERLLYVSCEDGTLWTIDRGDATATKIASGGSRGRAARASINGSLLLAQTYRIMRLTAPAGSGFGYQSPYDLTAVATGADKITLYWEQVPGATGYNVYRAFASGDEDYTGPPLNGSTPVTTHSYQGSNYLKYTDTGLFTGLEYFYTVKAVFPVGVSQSSGEVSEIPDPSAIPWDNSDPQVVEAAIRQACYDGEILVSDSLRTNTPDCRVYEQASPTGPVTVVPSDGRWMRYTDIYRSPDGTYLKDPTEAPDLSIQTLLSPIDGPYRRVISAAGFAGCKGIFHLPADSQSAVALSGEGLYLYMGSDSNSQRRYVDATLYKQFGHTGWTPVIFAKSKTLPPGQQLLNQTRKIIKGLVDIPGGQDVIVEYTARPPNSYLKKTRSFPCTLSVRTTSGAYIQTITAPIGLLPDGVNMIGVTQLGQFVGRCDTSSHHERPKSG